MCCISVALNYSYFFHPSLAYYQYFHSEKEYKAVIHFSLCSWETDDMLRRDMEKYNFDTVQKKRKEGNINMEFMERL
jgi:hypothetical protein